jgi:hypothetical protein
MNIFKKIWQKTPKIIKIPLTIMVVISAVQGFYTGIADDGKNASSQSAAKTANIAPQEKVISVSAVDLYNAYDENEVATDEKLKGAIIEITGTVQSIDKDFMDDINISLRSSNEYMPVNLGIEKSEKETAIKPRKGQKITARCKQISKTMGSPYGRKCIFMK